MWKWFALLSMVFILPVQAVEKKGNFLDNKTWPALKPRTPGAPSKGHTEYTGPRVRYFYNGREYIPLINPSFSWKADPAQPVTRAEIRIGEQKLYVYQGELLVGLGPVSTGRDSHPTPTGKFKVISKNKDHHSTLYGSIVNAQGKVINAEATPESSVPAGARYEPSEMKFYVRLTGDGVGTHAGMLPGFPASHGCIRLPSALAEKFYEAIPVGTPVAIVP